jgi:GNAT superfamily N-acetyltransferase
MTLAAPQALAAAHLLEPFDCGEASLNHWLQHRALVNHLSGASRTFVVADAQGGVHGYYALAAGAVAHETATGKVRRNMPAPIPVMVLTRLAVSLGDQGTGLGVALLRDAVRRTLSVAQDAGVRALLVHALHARARQFYEHYGFQPSPLHPLTQMPCLENHSTRRDISEARQEKLK